MKQQLEKTQFSTSRVYRADGTPQILNITFLPFFGDEWSNEAYDPVVVFMVDDARGLDYKLIVLKSDCTKEKIGPATLDAYDTNRQAPFDSKVGDCLAKKRVTCEQEKKWGIVPAHIIAKVANKTSRGVDFGRSPKSEIYRGVSGTSNKGYKTNFNKFCKLMDELARVHQESKKRLEIEVGKVFSENKQER